MTPGGAGAVEYYGSLLIELPVARSISWKVCRDALSYARALNLPFVARHYCPLAAAVVVVYNLVSPSIPMASFSIISHLPSHTIFHLPSSIFSIFKHTPSVHIHATSSALHLQTHSIFTPPIWKQRPVFSLLPNPPHDPTAFSFSVSLTLPSSNKSENSLIIYSDGQPPTPRLRLRLARSRRNPRPWCLHQCSRSQSQSRECDEACRG